MAAMHVQGIGNVMVIAVVGLGYVGLPLVVEFGKHERTIGFDIDAAKVAKCEAGSDPSREIGRRTHERRTSMPSTPTMPRRCARPTSCSSLCRHQWTTRASPISGP